MWDAGNYFMKKKIKECNFNYLLKTGAVIFCCTMFIFVIIAVYYTDKLNNLSRFDSTNNYFLLVFVSLLIAPIFEELSFRGYFTNSFLLKIITLIGCPIYIFITDNYYLYFLFFVLVMLHFVSKIDRIYVFVIHSILFSLVHYKFSDFHSIFTVIPMFFQFSVGLILIWIVLNFNLLRAIIVHFLFNLFFITILTIPLQFPDQNQNHINYLGYDIEWRKTPILTTTNTFISRPDEYTITAENTDLITFCKAFDFSTAYLIVKDNNVHSKFIINIKRIDSSANKLDGKSVILILKKMNLIE
jgi:membrane protease YdiL (CAAX protease family)